MQPSIKTLAAALLLVPLGAVAAPLAIEDAWVRALPPMQPTTAAYLRLDNRGSTAEELVEATLAGAGRVEIHSSREVDGMLQMVQLPSLTLPAGSQYVFAPGATHLMVFDLEAMPRPGETRTLCLRFASGATVCSEAQVRKGAAGDAGHHHHH